MPKLTATKKGRGLQLLSNPTVTKINKLHFLKSSCSKIKCRLHQKLFIVQPNQLKKIFAVTKPAELKFGVF